MVNLALFYFFFLLLVLLRVPSLDYTLTDNQDFVLREPSVALHFVHNLHFLCI